MSIELEEKRYWISLAYAGEGWKRRCMHMAPAQVVAVYNDFKKSGKLDALKRKFKPTKSDLKNTQISIEEYMGGK